MTFSKDSQPAEPPTPDPQPAISSSSRFAQLLLDPKALHLLMSAGGGLLALGLVIWLAVIGLFDNPVTAATTMVVGNLGLLGGSVWAAAKTGYRTASRGTALLACLLLPLNLWFFDAQGLVTLADGGNLWLPALGCCLVYAAVAWALRDSVFVYAITGGVALTGLLFLADGDVGRFWEVLAPSALLVTLGVGCVHAERLFPKCDESQSDMTFTRDDFGLAFFRAGHALLASGLVILLGGRLVGRYYTAVFDELGWFVQPDVSVLLSVKLAALGLALTGTYTYVYSRFLRGGERFSVMAMLTLGWAGVIVLELFGIGMPGTLLALSAIGCLAVVGGIVGNSQAISKAGRVAVALGGTAGCLLAANRVLGGGADLMLVLFTIGHVVLVSLSAVFSRKEEGRHGLVALSVVLTLTCGAVINDVSQLAFPQKIEVFATAVGWGLVGFGLIGWHRESIEEGEPDGMVDTNLWIGGLLATVPSTLGLLFTRFAEAAPWWEATHEIGVLAIGLLLVGIGVLCRLRATTLCGAASLAAYLLSLVSLISVPDQLQNVAVYLMVAGGLLFGGAVFLSICRDRLAALPEKARQGEGLFAVLNWR